MSNYKVTVNDREFKVELHEKSGSTLTFAIEGRVYTTQVTPTFNFQHQSTESAPTVTPLQQRPNAHVANAVLAPMPGIVVNVLVKEGDEVTNGQTLLVMEAMKMENNINSTRSGKIKKIHVKKGEEVQNGAVLVSFDA